MFVLFGILVMVVGLAMRFNALLVVVVAGFVTGLLGGLSVQEIVSTIGEAFTKNRYMSLFVLLLPVVGVMERHGLRERAEMLISKIRAATASRICMFYMLIRQVTVAFGMTTAGLFAFVRPLIAPMSEAAALQGREVSQETLDKIRAMAASSDNIGNFFGQNLFIASGGLLLIKGVFDQVGYNVSLVTMALYCIPTAIAAYVIASIRYLLLDHAIQELIRKESTHQANSTRTEEGGN